MKLPGSLCRELKCLGVAYLSDQCLNMEAVTRPALCWNQVVDSLSSHDLNIVSCIYVNITSIYIIAFVIKLNKVVQYDALLIFMYM